MAEAIGIAGCGLIGASWAGLFLASGLDVVAFDPSESMRLAFPEKTLRIAAQIDAMGILTPALHGKLTVVADVASLARSVSIVQENAPENVELKRALYAAIEMDASDDLVIASSTSSLVWSDLSAGMRHPRRLITAHPFNPPHVMPLVELYGTDDRLVRRMADFYRSLGRMPVILRKEAVGHLANRLASALWREAVHLVAEGVADVSEVDAALVNGPGLRWSVVGAHMAYHLGGGPGGIDHYLEHLGPSQERRWATLGTPALSPGLCKALADGVRQEAGGRSVADLEEERDRALVAVLKARRQSGA